jgi:hypothetical protein
MSVCDNCKNARWMIRRIVWKEDKLTLEWRPLDRGAWNGAGQYVMVALLGSGNLAHCKTCNPGILAPWAKQFSAGNGGGNGASY